MLVTNQFIIINTPKTGSTFLTQNIYKIINKRLSNLSFFERALIKLGYRKDYYFFDEIKTHDMFKIYSDSKHGPYTAIPEKYRDKKIYTVIREPFAMFKSRYQFDSRLKRPVWTTEEHQQKFEKLNNLNIDEYIELVKFNIDTRYKDKGLIPKDCNIGIMTIQFIHLFFKEPEKVLKNLTNDYLDSDQYLVDMADITFLNQKNLKTQLYSLLKSYNYPKEEISFILDAKKRNVSKEVGDKANIWTPSSVEYILNNERLLLKIYENLGYTLEIPSI